MFAGRSAAVALLASRLVGLACLALTGCRVASGVEAPPSGPSAIDIHASLALAPTRLPGTDEDVLVGTLDVPENRAVAGGRTIPLHVVVIPARRPAARRPPLYFLAGGPGGAASGAVGYFLHDVPAFREEREVVLMDARGTGGSAALHLPPKAPTPLLDALTEMDPPDWVAAGRAQLEQRADLTCYTTEDVVADLDAVRAALGHERIDLAGLSYGTRVALGYLRRHADRVHAAILQGTAPSDLRMPMQHAPAGQHALLGLFAECAADPAASARFGDLATKLQAVIERLTAAPEHASFKDPATGQLLDVTIRAELFAEFLRTLMYSRESSQVVPLLVQRAFEGRFDTLLRLQSFLATQAASGGPPIAEGFYLCVTCSEDVPFIDLTEAERLAQGTFCGDYRVQQQRRACALWPRAPLPADVFAPVTADTPVLVISGGLDPVTPESFAQEVVSYLPHARLVSIPRMGHLEDGLSNLECLEGLELEFLDRGSADGLDLTCLQGMAPGPFVLDESELTFLDG